MSVLLPFRNARPTIEEALDGVLAQEGVRLQVVAVDDGSTDGGGEVALGWAARYRALSVERTSGLGLVGALEVSLRAAEHGWLARMDGDDVCLPGRFAQQVDALCADERLGALGTRVSAFGDGVGRGMHEYVAWQNNLVSWQEHQREIFIESPLCHPSVMLRRTAIEEVGPWRAGPFPEDYDLWLRLDAAGWRLAKLPTVLLKWRHVPGRMTFADPKFLPSGFLHSKAPHLARRLSAWARPVWIWGAGPTGKRLARALEVHGVRASAFVDIDPRKLGRRARGAPIVPMSRLDPGAHSVVVAVGTRGARALIRAELLLRGFREGHDYLCAA